MAQLLKPDICVIGAGSGGLSVAAAAAAFGVPVVLIERGKMGGECLNTGCVPSKSLIAAGKRARAIADRSEEHTSELQSLTNLVCRLLPEKKNAILKTERNFLKGRCGDRHGTVH